MSSLTRDVRVGLRALRKTPAFTAGAVASVALTVGATTAIFSVVYGILIRQLPYRDAEKVVWIWSDQPGRDRTPFNVPDFLDYRISTRTLSGMAGFFAYSANLSDESAPERISGIRATGNFFDVLGAHAQLGRLLQPADEHDGTGRVVVLAERFWVRRFGADRTTVGRSIRLNAENYTVIGVLAPDFATPVHDVDFVIPFAPSLDPRRAARNSLNFIIAVGRRADWASPGRAASELTAIAHRLQRQFPVENARKRGVRLVPLLDGVVGSFRTALMTLFGAVAAVLLIASANLANLMLARATVRRKEIAVQLALGSSRWHIVRQVLIEALLVAISGGIGGILLAQWGVTGLVALAPTELPRFREVRVDVAVLLFSLGVSSLTGLLFGVVPALASARVDVREALNAEGRGTAVAGRRLRGLLVSAEVALAVMLLVVVTMLSKSFANVRAVDPGFDPRQVLSARLTLPARRFNNRNAIATFQQSLSQRLSALPGVASAGAISLLPLSGLLSRVPFTVEGRPIARERVPLAQFRIAWPGYFETVRIPLRRGRTFSEQDAPATRPVAVVNEALAGRWLDGLDPIGARLLVDDNDGPPRPVEIVGVVGNVQQVSLEADPAWDLYLTYAQIHPDTVGAAAANMFWVVRTAGDPMSLSAAVAREVRRLDADVVAASIKPLDYYLTESVASRRYSLSLMAVFAVAALALAMTGIYAVVLYSINQRARELGIRVALGASQANLVGVVMSQGVQSIAVGLVFGMAGAMLAARLLSTLLFGLKPTDVATFAQVAAAVTAASVPACALPAVRAWRLVVTGWRG